MVGAFFAQPRAGGICRYGAHGKQKMSSLTDCMLELMKKNKKCKVCLTNNVKRTIL